MGSLRKLKAGLLTSSRADFGIYLPLLMEAKNSDDFEIEVIAFGSHLSKFHGYSIEDIEKFDFPVIHRISSLLVTDDSESIAVSYGLTAIKFADFWKTHQSRYDFCFCLGDRFEMAAAVSAGIPFGIKFAHIHGGEKTTGAIDNIYRDCISLASQFHFVALNQFKVRLGSLLCNTDNIVVTGSLSLENINGLKILSIEEFKNKWSIDMSLPSILITVHPETVNFKKNEEYINQLLVALKKLVSNYQLIFTMPNADTNGSIFRQRIHNFKSENSENVFLIENFGTTSYFSCMKYSVCLIGNTSSGIIEAASFGKYVINLGERQNGRPTSDNVIHSPFEAASIQKAFDLINGRLFIGENVYKSESNPAKVILNSLRVFYDQL